MKQKQTVTYEYVYQYKQRNNIFYNAINKNYSTPSIYYEF